MRLYGVGNQDQGQLRRDADQSTHLAFGVDTTESLRGVDGRTRPRGAETCGDDDRHNRGKSGDWGGTGSLDMSGLDAT